MIYSSTSIQQVIARVIRNTRLQDSSFILDMNEWIPEAMGLMRTQQNLVLRWKPVQIQYHKGRLPCGLYNLLAVEYRGARVPRFTGERAFNSPLINAAGDVLTGATVGQQAGDLTVFGTQIVSTMLQEDGGYSTQTDLEQVTALRLCDAYYYTELDWINTSMSDACVIVHYQALPLDDLGFPLIPDNEDYKEALYWYCRGKMIGAGFTDRVYNIPYCDEKFEKHASRAIGQIRYPSIDMMEASVASQTRLVMPENWYDTFFTNMGKEPML